MYTCTYYVHTENTDFITEDNGSKNSAVNLSTLTPHTLTKLPNNPLVSWASDTVRIMTQLEGRSQPHP